MSANTTRRLILKKEIRQRENLIRGINMLIRNATVDDLDEVSSVEAQCFPVQEAATAEVFSQRLKY